MVVLPLAFTAANHDVGRGAYGHHIHINFSTVQTVGRLGHNRTVLQLYFRTQRFHAL